MTRPQPHVSTAAQPAPTLLRTLVAERHWQVAKAFRAQFVRAARELAERESDPAFLQLDVSDRQFQRWLDGAQPRPYSCRVLEYMFDRPIGELRRPAALAQSDDEQHRSVKGSTGRDATAASDSETAPNADRHVSREDSYDVRRRQFIHTLTGFALAAPPLVRLEALRHGLGHVIGADRGQWEIITAEYAQDFYTTPLDVLCDRLSVDIGILEQLLISHPDDRELARAAANLAMILAIALTFTGQTWMARRWWRTARDAADGSGDLGVRVMTRSQEAVKGLYAGSPVSSVLSLADETIAIAGRRVCPGVAGVLAGRAQALAITGRYEDAAGAIRAVEEMTAQMPGAALADESVFGWPEHRLRHTESFVYTEIGDTPRAIAAQDRALQLYPATQTTNRAMVQMHRASCIIQDRNIGDGMRYAAQVLDALPVETHNQLIYETARRAVATVPHNERSRPEFDDLRDRLSALPSRASE